MTKVTQAERNWAGALDRETDALLASHQSIVNGEEDSLVRAIIDHIDANPTPKMAAVIEAAKALQHAVCGATGFAAAVRADSGHAYPWPALDIAEANLAKALSQLKGEE